MNSSLSPLSPSKYNQLLEAADQTSERHGVTVYALGHTGLINKEFSNMSRDWLDPEDQVLQVPENVTRRPSIYRGRKIPLSEHGVERLEAFLESKSKVDLTPIGVTECVKSVGENTLNEKIVPQTLRVTFATRLHEVGVPQSAITQLLGHTPSDPIEVSLNGCEIAEEKIRSGLY